jgi:hypothetical protein
MRLIEKSYFLNFSRSKKEKLLKRSLCKKPLLANRKFSKAQKVEKSSSLEMP